MTARIGAPKTGGRRKGSLDKGERQLVTAEMASDIMVVYKKLGGVRWLLKFAEDNPAEFLRQGLSRLFPAPQKDDPDVVNNNTINVNNLSDLQIAQRVAFALSKGIYAQQALDVERDITPVARPDAPEEAFSPNLWQPPTDAPGLVEPTDMSSPYDADRQAWAASLPLTPAERQDQKLIRQTKQATISSYEGCAGEQGHGPVQRQSSTSKPSVAEIRRRQLL